MPIPEFARVLREHVGHEELWLPSVSVAVSRERAGSPGQREYVLVKRADDGEWACPGGFIDPGEEPAVAGAREVYEEAGVQVRIRALTGARVLPRHRYPNGDRTVVLDYLFAGEWVSGDAHPLDGEASEVAWFTVDELPAMQPFQRERVLASEEALHNGEHPPARFVTVDRDPSGEYFYDASGDPLPVAPSAQQGRMQATKATKGGTPEYIVDLRKKIGHALIWTTGATAVVYRTRTRDTASSTADGAARAESGEVEYLLIRRADNGRWETPAGFTDPGEEPAVTAAREAFEEASVVVRVDRLLWVRALEDHVYPNGDRSQVLDATFAAEWVSGEPTPDALETTEARWFTFEELPPLRVRIMERILRARDARIDAFFAREPRDFRNPYFYPEEIAALTAAGKVTES